MSFTTNQIEELRSYANDRKGELAKLISDAADTIELLSAKLHAANMERSSAHYHGGWIPVDERMPEMHEDPDPYLDENNVYITVTQSDDVLATTEDGDVVFGRFARWSDSDKVNFEVCVEEDSISLVTKATAWMPLPEAYKGDK